MFPEHTKHTRTAPWGMAAILPTTAAPAAPLDGTRSADRGDRRCPQRTGACPVPTRTASYRLVGRAQTIVGEAFQVRGSAAWERQQAQGVG